MNLIDFQAHALRHQRRIREREEADRRRIARRRNLAKALDTAALAVIPAVLGFVGAMILAFGFQRWIAGGWFFCGAVACILIFIALAVISDRISDD